MATHRAERTKYSKFHWFQSSLWLFAEEILRADVFADHKYIQIELARHFGQHQASDRPLSYPSRQGRAQLLHNSLGISVS
jgi:hypothetical protein